MYVHFTISILNQQKKNMLVVITMIKMIYG